MQNLFGKIFHRRPAHSSNSKLRQLDGTISDGNDHLPVARPPSPTLSADTPIQSDSRSRSVTTVATEQQHQHRRKGFIWLKTSKERQQQNSLTEIHLLTTSNPHIVNPAKPTTPLQQQQQNKSDLGQAASPLLAPGDHQPSSPKMATRHMIAPDQASLISSEGENNVGNLNGIYSHHPDSIPERSTWSHHRYRSSQVNDPYYNYNQHRYGAATSSSSSLNHHRGLQINNGNGNSSDYYNNKYNSILMAANGNGISSAGVDANSTLPARFKKKSDSQQLQQQQQQQHLSRQQQAALSNSGILVAGADVTILPATGIYYSGTAPTSSNRSRSLTPGPGPCSFSVSPMVIDGASCAPMPASSSTLSLTNASLKNGVAPINNNNGERHIAFDVSSTTASSSFESSNDPQPNGGGIQLRRDDSEQSSAPSRHHHQRHRPSSLINDYQQQIPLQSEQIKMANNNGVNNKAMTMSSIDTFGDPTIDGGRPSSAASYHAQQQQRTAIYAPAVPQHLQGANIIAGNSRCLVYLVYRGETRRALLPVPLSLSHDHLLAFFYQSFPSLARSRARLTAPTFLVLDPRSTIYQQLVDMRQIIDRCVIKLVDQQQHAPNATTTTTSAANANYSQISSSGHQQQQLLNNSNNGGMVNAARLAGSGNMPLVSPATGSIQQHHQQQQQQQQQFDASLTNDSASISSGSYVIRSSSFSDFGADGLPYTGSGPLLVPTNSSGIQQQHLLMQQVPSSMMSSSASMRRSQMMERHHTNSQQQHQQVNWNDSLGRPASSSRAAAVLMGNNTMGGSIVQQQQSQRPNSNSNNNNNGNDLLLTTATHQKQQIADHNNNNNNNNNDHSQVAATAAPANQSSASNENNVDYDTKTRIERMESQLASLRSLLQNALVDENLTGGGAGTNSSNMQSTPSNNGGQSSMASTLSRATLNKFKIKPLDEGDYDRLPAEIPSPPPPPANNNASNSNTKVANEEDQLQEEVLNNRNKKMRASSAQLSSDLGTLKRDLDDVRLHATRNEILSKQLATSFAKAITDRVDSLLQSTRYKNIAQLSGLAQCVCLSQGQLIDALDVYASSFHKQHEQSPTPTSRSELLSLASTLVQSVQQFRETATTLQQCFQNISCSSETSLLLANSKEAGDELQRYVDSLHRFLSGIERLSATSEGLCQLANLQRHSLSAVKEEVPPSRSNSQNNNKSNVDCVSSSSSHPQEEQDGGQTTCVFQESITTTTTTMTSSAVAAAANNKNGEILSSSKANSSSRDNSIERDNCQQTKPISRPASAGKPQQQTADGGDDSTIESHQQRKTAAITTTTTMEEKLDEQVLVDEDGEYDNVVLVDSAAAIDQQSAVYDNSTAAAAAAGDPSVTSSASTALPNPKRVKVSPGRTQGEEIVNNDEKISQLNGSSSSAHHQKPDGIMAERSPVYVKNQSAANNAKNRKKYVQPSSQQQRPILAPPPAPFADDVTVVDESFCDDDSQTATIIDQQQQQQLQQHNAAIVASAFGYGAGLPLRIDGCFTASGTNNNNTNNINNPNNDNSEPAAVSANSYNTLPTRKKQDRSSAERNYENVSVNVTPAAVAVAVEPLSHQQSVEIDRISDYNVEITVITSAVDQQQQQHLQQPQLASSGSGVASISQHSNTNSVSNSASNSRNKALIANRPRKMVAENAPSSIDDEFRRSFDGDNSARSSVNSHQHQQQQQVSRNNNNGGTGTNGSHLAVATESSTTKQQSAALSPPAPTTQQLHTKSCSALGDDSVAGASSSLKLQNKQHHHHRNGKASAFSASATNVPSQGVVVNKYWTEQMVESANDNNNIRPAHHQQATPNKKLAFINAAAAADQSSLIAAHRPDCRQRRSASPTKQPHHQVATSFNSSFDEKRPGRAPSNEVIIERHVGLKDDAHIVVDDGDDDDDGDQSSYESSDTEDCNVVAYV